MSITTSRPRNSAVRRLRVLGSALTLAMASLAVGTAPARAAFPGDNGKIYFAQDEEIYSIDPDGTDLTQLTTATGNSDNPRINATGTTVAFLRFSSDGNQVWTMNPDGSGGTQISTGSSANDGDLAWSPAGDRLVYSPGGVLTVIDADGTDPTELGVSGDYPAWSPDGTKIAYSSSGAIKTVNPDGTGETTIAAPPSGGLYLQPNWSRTEPRSSSSTAACG